MLDDLEVDVRLEQGEADLAHRRVDVGLAQLAARADVGEGRLEAVRRAGRTWATITVSCGWSLIGSTALDGSGRASCRRVMRHREAGNEADHPLGIVATPRRARANVRVERAQVLEPLPDADQLHRDAEVGGDRQRDAALGGAVELGQDDAVDLDRFGEDSCAWRRPFWPVVASIDDQRLVRRSGICFAITRRTFASSSIRLFWVWRRPAVSTMHDVGAAARRRRSRRRRPRRVGASSPLDQLGAGALGPLGRAARRRRRGRCRRRRGSAEAELLAGARRSCRSSSSCRCR